MKTFFFRKNTSYFLTFPTSKFSEFSPKNLISRAEKTFYEIMPFDTHSTANLPPISISKKKPICFSKKNPTLNVLRILTIRVAFYGKFATIWSKNNFTFSNVNKLTDVA